MKYLLGVIIFLLSFVIFIILEYGDITISTNELIQPFSFSLTVLILFLNSKSQKPILFIALTLLILMVILYLFNLLPTANLVGSLGVGLFIILLFSRIPELIKNGHI